MIKIANPTNKFTELLSNGVIKKLNIKKGKRVSATKANLPGIVISCFVSQILQ